MVDVLRPGRDDVAPIVCIHPVTGLIDAYRPLAAALAWPGPILAIPAPPPPEVGFELAELAASYLRQLPAAPLRVLGWGLGGVIAAEMAALAGAARFVGLIDSRAPTPDMRARPTDRATLEKAFQQHVTLSGLAVPPEAADTFIELVRAFYRHTPRHVPVPIDVFCATESHPSHARPPTLGWDELAPTVTHHPAAGNHFTVLAHAAALAQAIGTLIT